MDIAFPGQRPRPVLTLQRLASTGVSLDAKQDREACHLQAEVQTAGTGKERNYGSAGPLASGRLTFHQS